LIEFPLESISPPGVVLDNLLEVIEELAIGINAGDLNVREGVADEVSLKKRHGLQVLQACRYFVKQAVQVDHLSKQRELHGRRPRIPRAVEGRRKSGDAATGGKLGVGLGLADLNEKPASCGGSAKQIASVAAIVASFKATLVRGAWVLVTPARPATSRTLSTVSGVPARFLSVLLGFVLL
jgi:hypothetical protein